MKLKLKDALVLFNYHCKYEKNLTDKTIRAYDIDLGQFKEFNMFGEKLIQSFTKYDIKDYVKFLYDRRLQAKSIKRKVASIKCLFSFLVYEDIIEVSPFNKLKLSIKLPQKLPKTIQMREIKYLFNYLYNYKKSIENKSSYEYKLIVRDIAVIELLFATGIRVNELCSLKPKHIDISQGHIIVQGKGRKERTIQLCNNEIKKVLAEYYKLHQNIIHKIDCFFVNKLGKVLNEDAVRHLIDKYRNDSGIQTKITPHMFRSTMATELIENDVDIRIVQLLLGHTSIVTTQIYTNVSHNKKKKVLEEKHPRVNMKILD